jgi:hypothetical protein
VAEAPAAESAAPRDADLPVEDAPAYRAPTDRVPVPTAVDVERDLLDVGHRSVVSSRRLTLAFGAQAAAQSGVTPDVVMTVPVFVALALEESRNEDRFALRFAPGIRLVGVFGGSDDRALARLGSEYRWTAGAVDGCLLNIGVSAVSASPCARLELGALAARTEQRVPGRTDSRLWAAVALAVRVRIEASSRVFFELEAAPRLPLVRARYERQPADMTAFRAPPLGWTAGAGVGLRFP